jgi:hypothetical protein
MLQQPPSAGGLVVAIDLPSGFDAPNDSELQRSLSDILQIGGEVPNAGPVAVAFAGVNRRLLTLAIADVNARHDARLSSGGAMVRVNPILVVAPESLHYWIGGTPRIREILSNLSQARSPRYLEELKNLFGEEYIEREVREQLERTGLLRLNDGLLSLNLLPQDVMQALVTHFGNQIEAAVDDGNAQGVVSDPGLFITPSLRLATRWIDVQELLIGLQCERMAGLLLAVLVGDRVGYFYDKNSVSVLKAGTVSDYVLAGFARSLTGFSKFQENISGLPTMKRKVPLSRSPEVLICTDLISTEHTIRQTIDELRALGTLPLAVATVIDARTEQSSPQEDFLHVDGHDIPLVKLARVSITPPEGISKGASRIHIDPVVGTPLPERPKRIETLADQEDYISAVIRTDAARLGHIARPARRHYSAYVDPTLLLRDRAWAEGASDAIVVAAQDSRNESLLEHTDASCILFPAETSDYLDSVVSHLTTELQDRGINVISAIKVPRAVSESEWTFPVSISLPEEAVHAIVFDSSTGTGRTLLQLLRLASLTQIKAITAFVLADGLNELDAIALQQIRSVEPMQAASETLDGGHLIPVRIHYLARTAVQRIDAGECSICRLRESYEDISLPIPETILPHQAFLSGALAPRTKGEVFLNRPTDLFGVPIVQSDCIAYLRLRARLRSALFSTSARRWIVDKLDRLVLPFESDANVASAVTVPQRDALIRLLVAESHWLDKAPLCFADSRSKVGDICTVVIKGFPGSAPDPILRIQAIIVLAAAVPVRFAEDVAELFLFGSDHELVLSQLLLECFRLLGSPRTPAFALEALAKSLDGLEGRLRDSGVDVPPEVNIDLFQEVRYLSSVAKRSLHLPDDPD